MEDILVLVINDEIRIDINHFTETVINHERADFTHPEAYADISNLNADLSFANNLVINKLAVLKNDKEIWHSERYSNIKKLELNINEDSARYTLAFI